MAKALHGLVFVLLAAQFIVAVAMPDIGRDTKLDTLIAAALYHFRPR
jgi:hypothetical protein